MFCVISIFYSVQIALAQDIERGGIRICANAAVGLSRFCMNVP